MGTNTARLRHASIPQHPTTSIPRHRSNDIAHKKTVATNDKLGESVSANAATRHGPKNPHFPWGVNAALNNEQLKLYRKATKEHNSKLHLPKFRTQKSNPSLNIRRTSSQGASI